MQNNRETIAAATRGFYAQALALTAQGALGRSCAGL
jgi:hypothetical protein